MQTMTPSPMTAPQPKSLDGAMREVITERLKRAALSSGQLDKIAGLSNGYTQHVLKGTRRPSSGFILKIASVLGTTPNQLWNEARHRVD